MDAASLPQRDTRRCARPGCADVASATLSFRYDLSQAWVLPLTEEPSPATYDLCGPCADRTKPPRGWHLVDERPDLDAASAAPQEHDVVRAAIAAALRGQGSGPLEVVPDTPSASPEPVAPVEQPSAPSPLRAVPDAPSAAATTMPGTAAPRTPTAAPTPLADRLGQVPLTVPRVPSPPLAVRDRSEVEEVAPPTPVARRRPVEVLIQPVVDQPAPVQAADEVPAAPTVAGDDDLVAALRDHQADLRVAEESEATGQSEVTGQSDAPGSFPASSFDMHPVQAAAMHLLVGEGRPEPTLDRPTSSMAVVPDIDADRPSASAEAVAMPLAFDDAPDRFVSLGMDDLGEFSEDDLIAGLRDDKPRQD